MSKENKKSLSPLLLFLTSPIWGVEALAKLILTYLHLDKVSKKHYLKIASLSKQQAPNSLLDD